MAVHRYTFYVIDDLCHVESGRPFVATSGLTLEEAVQYYRALPHTQEKALGISADGVRSIELVVCHPVPADPTTGRNMLLPTYLGRSGWRRSRVVAAAVAMLKRELSIEHILDGELVLPCPDEPGVVR
ncbi:hypothetical protein [Sporobacter termitidis]|nr:hypothetical protein [Sporobacter termitidis]